MGETKLRDCFLRGGVAGISKPTVRKEEGAIYTRVQNTGRYYRCNRRYHRRPRSKHEKAEKDARKSPTGTTGLGPVPPASAGPTGGRPVPPAVQNVAKQQFCENFACRYHRRFTGTTGGSRYYRSKPGTTGSSFSRKTKERTGTVGTTGPEGRYYRLTLAEKELSEVRACKCVSQAQNLS